MNQSPQQQGKPDLPAKSGMLSDLVRQLRLVWRLYWDSRVPLWVKTIPTAALAYVIWPIDVIPELAVPLIGALDDLGLVLLGLTTFVNLCPPDVVQEHMQAILGESGWTVTKPDQPGPPPEPKVIEAPYTIQPEKDKPKDPQP